MKRLRTCGRKSKHLNPAPRGHRLARHLACVVQIGRNREKDTHAETERDRERQRETQRQREREHTRERQRFDLVGLVASW